MLKGPGGVGAFYERGAPVGSSCEDPAGKVRQDPAWEEGLEKFRETDGAACESE